MPMVASGSQHRINILTLEDLTHLGGFIAVVVTKFFHRYATHDFGTIGLRIGDGDKLNVWLLQKASKHLAAARANADCAEYDTITRCDSAIFAERAGGNDCWQAQSERCSFEESATSWIFHGGVVNDLDEAVTSVDC